MTFLIHVKRAAKDIGIFHGETEDLNWEPSHVIMYQRLCNRYDGHFSTDPSRNHQNPSFLEFIDKYSDPSYTLHNEIEEPISVDTTDTQQLQDSRQKITNSIIQSKAVGRMDLRQLIPEALPVNKENASNQEIKERNNMVNENAIGNSLKLNTDKENTNEKTVEPGVDGTPKSEVSEGTAKEENEARLQKQTSDGKSNSNSDTTVSGETTQRASTQTRTKSTTGATSQRNSGSTVKVR